MQITIVIYVGYLIKFLYNETKRGKNHLNYVKIKNKFPWNFFPIKYIMQENKKTKQLIVVHIKINRY